jgi:hypothetical protein
MGLRGLLQGNLYFLIEYLLLFLMNVLRTVTPLHSLSWACLNTFTGFYEELSTLNIIQTHVAIDTNSAVNTLANSLIRFKWFKMGRQKWIL